MDESKLWYLTQYNVSGCQPGFQTVMFEARVSRVNRSLTNEGDEEMTAARVGQL